MITVDRQALAGALSTLNRTVERRSTVPILTHILLAADGDGQATLTATDLDLVASARIEASGGKLAMAAPAETLRQLVARAPGDDVTVEIAGDGAQAVVASGRARSKVNLLPAADFPQWAPRDYSCRIELAGAELADIFGRPLPAVLTGKSASARSYLCGIHLGDEGDDLAAVATDGHQLIRRIVSGAGGRLPQGIIVPDKAARILAAAVGDVAKVTLEASDTSIRVAAGGIVVSSKLVDGTFPDYRRVIPEWQDRVATVPSQALAAAAERAALVASRGVALAFAAGLLTVSGFDPAVGEHEETLEIDYAGDDVTIGMAGRLIASGLAAIDGDKVELSFSDAGSPMLMAAPGDRRRLAVLMPMRL